MKLFLALSIAAYLEGSRQIWLLDDFESAEHVAANELSWIALGDDLMGGTSSLTLSSVPHGANGSGHSLRLDGTVGSGPTAFTGAWAPLDGQSRPVDLGAFDALHFFARGEGTFQAGMRSGPPAAMANFMASFTAEPEWKEFEIPFDRLVPVGPGSSGASWHPEEVHWFGITTIAGASGPFHLEIDDVELVSHRSDVRPVPIPRDVPPRTIRFSLSSPPSGNDWREIARDPDGDGKKPSLPDAVSVAVMADEGSDRIWFRIGLNDAPPAPWFGLNLAFDVDGDGENGMKWWGANTSFHFDRLVSVWLFKTGPTYQGVAGTAEAADVSNGNFMTEKIDLDVAMDPDSRAFLVGLPRSVLGQDGHARFLAAVGSAMANNDDVPDSGGILLPQPTGTK